MLKNKYLILQNNILKNKLKEIKKNLKWEIENSIYNHGLTKSCLPIFIFNSSFSVLLTFYHTLVAFLDFVLDSVLCLAWNVCTFSQLGLDSTSVWIETNKTSPEHSLQRVRHFLQSQNQASNKRALASRWNISANIWNTNSHTKVHMHT